MNMPFRLPKSINQNPWLSPLTAASCLETLGSSTTMSLTLERPIIVVPSLRGNRLTLRLSTADQQHGSRHQIHWSVSRLRKVHNLIVNGNERSETRAPSNLEL